MKKSELRNWDKFAGRSMQIPMFVYGRDDLQIGPLNGFCRGHGAITGNQKKHHDTIGIYTAEGVYHNIVIDMRVKCVIPMFFINGEPYYYAIVACLTMCGGLPVIDPATGNMQRGSHEHDDAWIIDHSDELKAELLEIAKAGGARPAPGTLLGRALEMFTDEGK